MLLQGERRRFDADENHPSNSGVQTSAECKFDTFTPQATMAGQMFLCNIFNICLLFCMLNRELKNPKAQFDLNQKPGSRSQHG